MASYGEKLSCAFDEFGHLCVGIDPSHDQLQAWGLPISPEGARSFALEIVEAASTKVGILKAQVAFFEQFGPQGLSVLEDVLSEIQTAGILVIADAKRGDIGSTMTGYMNAWLAKEAAFQCDALTVSPFLGPSSLTQAAEVAIENNKGLFILAATSNPEAREVQQARESALTVTQKVVDFAGKFRSESLGSIGVVIGATTNPQDLSLDETSLKSLPLLVPGFGAQGIRLTEAKQVLGSSFKNAICSVSRLVAGSSTNGLSERIDAANTELAEALA